MQTTDKSGISTFINTAVNCGMKHVVCSPGSRNAPLVIAIDNHPGIESIVIHDERCAAFYALGMAQQLNAPVGVVCTSGSAMLNYYPAVAEAFYQCIPLVVMSADRPAEWVNHGDGQTIVQTGVYTNHIRFEGSVDEFVDGEKVDELKQTIVRGFSIGCGNWKGPVHFNFPVSEPLYGLKETLYSEERIELLQESSGSIDLPDDFIEAWNRSERKMILCGQMDIDPGLLNRLSELADDTSVAVLVENTSNLQHPRFVHCIDRTLSAIKEDEITDFHPDLLITLGGAIISKRIKKFLRDANLHTHCRVGYAFPEMDTYRALTHSLECSASIFMKALLHASEVRNKSNFGARWKQQDYLIEALSETFIWSEKFCDLTVFNTILDYVPENSILHMGNSSVVRYCQLFNPVKSIRYYSNRGTSGVDGSTSTACGAALVKPDICNVLITGDVSFFYDSNALWSNHLPSNLRIILINNGGGGIFRIIDGPSTSSQLEKYFEAKHTHSAEHICKAFGVDYFSADSIGSIEEKMEVFYQDDGNQRPKLLEVFTPSEINDKVLKDFFNLSRMS